MSHQSAICECGLSYAVGYPDDEAIHAEYHCEYLLGPQVSRVLRLPTIATKRSLRLVRTDVVGDDAVIQEEVLRAVEVAGRCTPEYPHGYYGPETAGDHRMYILVGEARASAMVLIKYDKRFLKFTWKHDGRVELHDSNPLGNRAPKVARIWVAAANRRQGLAKWLVEKISLNMGVEIGSFGWELPLTLDSGALVKSLCPESFLGCGDCHSVQDTIDFFAAGS